MPPVAEHYEALLAPVYSWMVGGTEAAIAMGQADLAPVLPGGTFAIDLGAGFGMHSIPLARAGWRVLAIDSSPVLLGQLSALAEGLGVRACCGDLLGFAEYLSNGERADLVLCMGDTLTHLETPDALTTLSRTVAAHLSPRGRFVATFRDYSRLPSGEARFIPVRADEHRILTCFLEEFEQHVQVHDLLHERIQGKWVTRVSSYRKLRLSPENVRQAFVAAGLKAIVEPGP
ncbi:MAG TPA: methyltransferase domain-containing protein, partial [Burkholderiaceae bacterium]